MNKLISLLLFFLVPFYTFGIGDSTRNEINLNLVYQSLGLSGDSVIVAIIDRGIDYTHPDFIDENGETRIAYIYDMLDPTGASAPGNPYGIGTIYSSVEINQALSSGTSLPTNDLYGHGIATTGIAAGNGSAALNGQYRGVAHGATIIAVKAFTDYFPPINGNPGQNGSFTPAYLETALDFVKAKTTELALPSVTLMNLGSIGGPTDGSSQICRKMDAFVGEGRILVCGTGDDGGSDNRAGATISQGDTIDITFKKAAVGNLRLELWYENVDRLDIGLKFPAGTVYGPFTAVSTENDADTKNLTGLAYYHRGSDVDFSASNNSQRQVLMDFSGDTGTYVLTVIGSQISNGTFSVSMNPGTYFNNNRFLTNVQPGAINDYASALKVIVPTDYVHQNSWIDVDGVGRARVGEGDPGELWIGSSFGPTQDGRIGVDVAAPGEVLFTSYSPGTYYSQFRFNQIQGGNGRYGLQNAVSAASPVVTGVIALMLEVAPTLTAEEVKMILQSTARQDAFTGSVPNTQWGYGKIDAYAAVTMAMGGNGINELERKLAFKLYPNPAASALFYSIDAPTSPNFSVTIMDMRGRHVFSTSSGPNGTVSLTGLGTGVYVFQLTTSEGILRKSFVVAR